MSTQHTQGQLVTGSSELDQMDLISEDGLEFVAAMHEFGSMPGKREANARRLAACWNACEGVSTEDLEADHAHKGGPLLNRKLREHKLIAQAMVRYGEQLAAARALLAEILAGDDARIAALKSCGSLNLPDFDTSPAWAMTKRIRAFLKGGAV